MHCVHHDLVEIHRAVRHLPFLYHPANPAHDITGTATICDDVTEQFANFPQIKSPLSINRCPAEALLRIPANG